MNDSKKTLIFVAVGLVALFVGFQPWKGRAPVAQIDEAGAKLFPEFENAHSATSLEIIQFNEETSTIKPFKVAQVNGVWAIPSHQNYPADAKEHLAAAATALIGLEILGVAGDSPGEHEEYGVIDPDASTLKAGAQGVGERIILKGAKDTTLADLIIGKEIQPGLRFVRKPGKNQVYRVAISTDKFSTKFEDWIEKDLLKLNPFDIREIDINDYAIREVQTSRGIGLGQIKSSEMKLTYDDAKSQWSLADFVVYDEEGKPKSEQLGETEELDTQKLNDLRTALDDLKIVDVEHKPKGLSGDLSISEELLTDQSALENLSRSLAVRGFFPAGVDDKQIAIVSKDGEVITKLKDGVDYVVRFGSVAGGSGDAQQEGLNRFVMITAQLDKSAIPAPELEELPSDEPDDKEEADAEKPEATTDEAKPAEAEDQPQEAKTTAEDAARRAKLEEERDRIEKENQRKLDAYNEKIKAAEDKVKELNDRFADWYYVISDDVYKKIHLSRGDVVKKKETEAGEGDSVGDFNALEQGLGEPDGE
jgi:hypothetical protein